MTAVEASVSRSHAIVSHFRTTHTALYDRNRDMSERGRR